jgi:hypothetical protein
MIFDDIDQSEDVSACPAVSISSGQQNLMKTYHNEANTSGITKIASKMFLKFFEQSS